MFDPSEYMKPFRKYADIDVGGLVFPDPSEIRFGEKGYAGELTQFFKTNVTNVWSSVIPADVRLAVLEELGTLALSMVEGVTKSLVMPLLEAINDLLDAVPFIGAIVKQAVKALSMFKVMGDAHAQYLDMDRIFKRWLFERFYYLKGGGTANAFYTMDRMITYRSYGPTGVFLKESGLYRRIGAFWGTSPNTVVEITPIFYPWVSPALGLEPLKAIPKCHTFNYGVMPPFLKCWGKDEAVSFGGSLYSGPKTQEGFLQYVDLPSLPEFYDRNSMFSAYQASLLQDPAANFAIPTSLIQRLTKVLDDLKPGTKKGRLNADSFEVTADHITTAKRGMAVFLQAREGFLADPNACLRAASSGVRLDPALKTVIKENANQGLKDIAGGLGSGSSNIVTISPDALKKAAEALEAQQKSDSSGGAAILLLGAAAAAAGIYAVTRKR